MIKSTPEGESHHVHPFGISLMLMHQQEKKEEKRHYTNNTHHTREVYARYRETPNYQTHQGAKFFKRDYLETTALLQILITKCVPTVGKILRRSVN